MVSFIQLVRRDFSSCSVVRASLVLFITSTVDWTRLEHRGAVEGTKLNSFDFTGVGRRRKELAPSLCHSSAITAGRCE